MRFGRKNLTILFLTLFMFAIFASVSTAAPSKMPMENGYLLVLPEYDKNNVIVNFVATYVNNTNADFNSEFWFYAPKDAKLDMVCETENGMACQIYDESTLEGDYKIVKWKPSRAIKPGEKFPVMFEYSFGSFSQPGVRDIPVKFKADSEVKNIAVEVRQPLRSSNFKMEPQPQSQGQDIEGFTVHTLQYPSLAELQELNLKISYTKEDSKPSVDVEESAPAGAAAAGNQSQQSNSLLIVLFIGFLAVLGVILAFGLKNNKQPAPVKTKHDKQNKAKQTREVQEVQVKAKASPVKNKGADEDYMEQKKKIRKLLLDGKISEQTYNQLIKELEG